MAISEWGRGVCISVIGTELIFLHSFIISFSLGQKKMATFEIAYLHTTKLIYKISFVRSIEWFYKHIIGNKKYKLHTFLILYHWMKNPMFWICLFHMLNHFCLFIIGIYPDCTSFKTNDLTLCWLCDGEILLKITCYITIVERFYM